DEKSIAHRKRSRRSARGFAFTDAESMPESYGEKLPRVTTARRTLRCYRLAGGNSAVTRAAWQLPHDRRRSLASSSIASPLPVAAFQATKGKEQASNRARIGQQTARMTRSSRSPVTG